jgi:predicted ATPase/class 3 adenylate cyclase
MRNPPASPPTGTVTFLFSDIEGSTRLAQRFGEDWPALLERHRDALRSAFAPHGWEQGTEGDSFFITFASATDAVAAAAEAQRTLTASEWPDGGRIAVRMGLHTGEGRLSGNDYVGLDVHRAARIGAAGHGGQVLLSSPTAALIEHDLPAGMRLVDLGEHRLKDLPHPERIHQLVIEGLPSEFRPLRSLGGRTSNVPVALSSLVGRESDIDAVHRLLAGARLVTVTGPGGTGKTRLVQEVARRFAPEFADGATFVPLEALRDSELIAVEILRSLRLDTAASTPPRERVIEYLAERQALLVLDNLEQLDGAAGVIGDLLRGAPDLKVLASSQAALHVGGEQEYALQPLADAAAVDLFVERARSVRPEFKLEEANRDAVIAICARLDGLPLAIELAAVQVRLLSPGEILARITDRLDALASRQWDLPERQRTLRATVGWSYDLLPEEVRGLFRRLSVFVGGARLAEIEAFERRRGADGDVLAALESLVDRSLVVVRDGSDGESRFAMLETIRTFARGMLRDGDEETVALADHAAVYRALGGTSEAELYGLHRRACLDRLADNHDNLRAALDHLEASSDLEGALDLAASLWRFWQSRGHLLEARERLERLLLLADRTAGLSPALLSRAEEAAGSVAYWRRVSSGSEVEPHYRRSLELAREAGDPDRIAWALHNLAFVYDFVPGLRADASDPDRGLEIRQEALRLFRQVGDRRGIGEALWAIGGNPFVMRDEPERAREQLAEASAVLVEAGDSYGASWAAISLGLLDADTGQPDRARRAIASAAEIFLRDEDLSGELVALQALGSIAARGGDDRTAVRLASLVEQAAHRIGIEAPAIPMIVGPLEAARARLSAEDIAHEAAAAQGADPRAVLEAELSELRAGRAQ